jgi:hypothetical protein
VEVEEEGGLAALPGPLRRRYSFLPSHFQLFFYFSWIILQNQFYKNWSRMALLMLHPMSGEFMQTIEGC